MRPRMVGLGVAMALCLAVQAGRAQTTAGCQAVTDTAATAAQAEIGYLRNNVRKPQSVAGLTCLALLSSVTSLSADALVGSIADTILTQLVNQVCNALNNYWQQVLNELQCGVTIGVGLGFPNLGGLGGGQICQFNIGNGYGATVHLGAGTGADGGGFYVNGQAQAVEDYGK